MAKRMVRIGADVEQAPHHYAVYRNEKLAQLVMLGRPGPWNYTSKLLPL
jgi:hypothetical protein